MTCLQVGQQAGVGRLPPEGAARDGARRGDVEPRDERDSAEVFGRVLSGDAADRTGTSRWRPMASAMSVNGTPSSAVACRREPAGAPSSARRNRCAASRRCTAGHRLAPSPTKAEVPRSRAMPTSVGRNPWSPSPWTVGGRRTADERTPRPAMARTTASVCARGPAPGSGASASLDTRPVVTTPATPEAMTRGRSVPSSAPPSARTASRSVRAAAGKSVKSWMNAVWTTPSAAAAAARRPSRSSSAPRRAVAPTDSRAAAAVPERARPTTSCPAARHSATTADPM
ncbi:hypothetical protein BD833_101233 [Blastococcus xanthinilyticus]|uniref:Uncharacterized protein n=1 Tax=Blastococcus xanthinilyticus TaxID=1564164 RepID=A0A5S5D486_9ACTN|nr:hypothetical protein BD833_101233 [Blastococcus xanthinilyticus]